MVDCYLLVMSILKKIQTSLNDPRIVVCSQYHNGHIDEGTNRSTEYGWTFDVVPKVGFNRLDSDSISEIARLQTEVFGELEDCDLDPLPPEFDGVFSARRWIDVSYPELVPWAPSLLNLGGVSAYEPVGIRETWTQETARISPAYEDEFKGVPMKDRRYDRTSHLTEAISRDITVRILPSLEYFEKLKEILNEQQDLLGNMGENQELIDRYRFLKSEKERIGFNRSGTISINHYNDTFGR